MPPNGEEGLESKFEPGHMRWDSTRAEWAVYVGANS